jgi:hypothetical protein
MYPGKGKCSSGRGGNGAIPAAIQRASVLVVYLGVALLSVENTASAADQAVPSSSLLALADSSFWTLNHIVWAILVILISAGSGLIWAESLTRSRKSLEDQTA